MTSVYHILYINICIYNPLYIYSIHMYIYHMYICMYRSINIFASFCCCFGMRLFNVFPFRSCCRCIPFVLCSIYRYQNRIHNIYYTYTHTQPSIYIYIYIHPYTYICMGTMQQNVYLNIFKYLSCFHSEFL